MARMATRKTSLNGTKPTSVSTGIYAHIVGWGMAVPEKVLTNDDLAAIVETTDEWIVARTGIKERRIASDKETSSTLGLKAAMNALEVADVLPTELDLIICATSTPEYTFPSTASQIQSWLGASHAGAFDLSAACSGFVYALHMGAQAIRSGSAQSVLVIGAETMSRVMDWTDRTTCILFGDGAGAVVLSASDMEGGILSTVLRSDGSGGDLLGLPAIGSIDTEVIPLVTSQHKMGKMHMAGGEVFKFATHVIVESIPQALEMAGIALGDLKLVIPHQANARILKAAARSLKMDENLFVSNLERYGNTSAASIPIALCEAINEGRIQQDDHIALVGFGGGLTWAAMVIKWGIPEQGDRTNRFNRQRRQFGYTVADWRLRLLRLSRQANETLRRIRPQKGKMDRLSRKVERYPFE